MASQVPDSMHSNAFNFSGFVAGGVDPRTGVYTSALTLGTILSTDLNGPSFNLALGFNPLNLRNAGFGSGWSLNTSRYDLRSNIMTLSSGESYKAVETSKKLQFKEMKLESAKVLKIRTGRYEVRYKDGRREELAVYGTSRIAVPVRIFAANGTSISLRYTLFNEQPMLIEIKDATNILLKVGLTADRVTLTQNPDSPSCYEFTLTIRNDRVSAIGLPVGRGWDLEYEVIDDISYLTRVESPLGAVEQIHYKQIGHLLPTLDGVQSLPYVIAHDIFPKQGQPKITKTYTYSDWNYLGHGVPPDSNYDGDPLYRAPGDYQYSCTESLMVGGKGHTRTKRTYNKFHLLISEVTRCGDAVAAVSTEYHCAVGKPFTEQPAQFRMPRNQIRSYENRVTKKKRSETSITEFDSAGNLLRQVEADGVTTLFEYYPDSASADCPADPLGFVRFLKQKTVVPAAGGGASTVTRYRYGVHPALEGTAMPSVVPVEESFFELTQGREVMRSKVELTYMNTPQDPSRHGALQQQSLIRNGTTTRTEYSYVLDANTLVLKKTMRGFDGTTRSTEQKLSTLSGLTLSERDADDRVVEFEYDKLGRRLSQTLSPGTVYAAAIHWSFQAASVKEPATMVMTDASGGVQKIIYDGLGRVIEVQERDRDNPDATDDWPMRSIYTALHDQAGRLVEQTFSDWWDGVARPTKSQAFFDDWGQAKEVRHGDGTIEHSVFDPVESRHKRWRQGMGHTVTIINTFGMPDSVEIFNLADQSLGKTVYEYDGLGRTISQTDATGNKTCYEYDVFDRMVRSVLPDGQAVETEFAAHSAEELPVEIKVAGKPLGQQTFDGLSRMIESSVGGRTWLAGYEGGRSQAMWHTNANGQRTEFVHSSGLGGALTERKAVIAGQDEGLITRFTYDVHNGKTTSCIEQGREHHFEYFPSGRVKSETTKYGELEKTVFFTYTLAGQPRIYVDPLGIEHKTEYADSGRKTSFKQGSIDTRYFYNPLGLLERIETEDVSTGHGMITRLTYDDIGREITRMLEVGNQASKVLTSSYDATGKLARKVLKHGILVLRDEQFAYDPRGRLVQYDCAGVQRPRDPYGKEIVQQVYTFDALDNILTLQTTFPGGVNLTSFTYSELDPAQLVEVSHSHSDYPPPVTLAYDANGQMVKDDQSRTLTYDAFGRLTQVDNAQGVTVRGFHYDGFDLLVEMSQPGIADAQRYYHAGKMVNEVRGGDSCSLVHDSGLMLGQQQRGTGAGVRLFGTDQQQSVLSQLHGQQLVDSVYSPYGHRIAEGGLFSLAGFNGEQLDAATGLYLLGNGYRAYSTTLMRFTSPDSMSPFGAGGLNAYAYCLGDPVNRADPTGHVSWQSIAGVVLGVFGIVASIATLGAATPLGLLAVGLGVASGATAIASALAHELDPQSSAGDILGYISLGLGLASLGAGLAAQAIKGASQLAGAFKSGLSSDSRAAASAMARGMGGRNTRGTSAGSERWTYKTYNYKKPEAGSGGKGAIPGFDELTPAERANFFLFKDGIQDGLTPADAARRMGIDHRYNEMIPFRNATPLQRAEPGFFNRTGHTEIRLGGGKRLFFYAHKDIRTVTMFAFSHTVKGA